MRIFAGNVLSSRTCFHKFKAMKYIIRAIKYFFYFLIIFTLIVTALVLIGAVEGDLDAIFRGGTESLWKIAIFFALVAAVYPKVGFITRDVTVDKEMKDIHDDVIAFFKERHYDLESESNDCMTFRAIGVAGKLSKMYEDRITLTKTSDGYTLEGLRKDVMRLAAGLEHSLSPVSEE